MIRYNVGCQSLSYVDDQDGKLFSDEQIEFLQFMMAFMMACAMTSIHKGDEEQLKHKKAL